MTSQRGWVLTTQPERKAATSEARPRCTYEGWAPIHDAEAMEWPQRHPARTASALGGADFTQWREESMGCDIHMVVEVYDWHKNEDAKRWQMVLDTRTTYCERNYGVFSVLAGVRNYHDTKPLAANRGVPEDASPSVKAESGDYGPNGHSHSWATAAEVLAYDWSGINGSFVEWVRWVVNGPTLLSYVKPEHIRFVFWFDN